MGREARSNRIAILIVVALFLGQWALLFIAPVPSWDAAFYYAYGRSIVFDHDLHLGNDLLLSYPSPETDFAKKGFENELTATGYVQNPFAVGSAIFWIPLLEVLHFGSRLLGIDQTVLTGYEWPFVEGVAILSALYGLAAFVVAFKVASQIANRRVALFSAATLMFTTSLLYYQFRSPIYSHAPSAFITTAVIYFWYKDHTRRQPSAWRAILLGLLIGLAGLVRWQHAIYVFLPLTSAILWIVGSAKPREKTVQVITYLVLVGMAALAVFSIQLAVWRLFFGSWITIPQGNSFIDWRAIFIGPTLFSTFHGLFTWMPITVPAIVGLLFLVRNKKQIALPMLIVLLLEIYINGSTRDWFGGGGFGPRRFTSELAIFVVGYAHLLERLPQQVRTAAALLMAVILGLHEWILLKFGIPEQIGGRVLSMQPDFRWEDESWLEYGREIASYVPAIWQDPLAFFVLPGSPLDQWINQADFPWQGVQMLLGVGASLALVMWGWHTLRIHWPQRLRSPALQWGLFSAVMLGGLLLINLWVLFRA